MRHIDTANYHVTVRQQVDGQLEEVDVEYKVRDSLIALLFSQQGLSGVDLLDRDDFARKIRDDKTDDLYLEEAEYTKLANVFNEFRGFSRNDVELVRRVLKAEQVAVQPVA
jgi:hypothetical protein